MLQVCYKNQALLANMKFYRCTAQNGLTTEHEQAIGVLTKLEELIWFMDGDSSRKKRQ